MYTEHDEAVYDFICRRLDSILIETGLRRKCSKCSKKGYVRKPKWLPKQGGCCTGCQNLGKNGCRGNAMACKFWFCNKDHLNEMLKRKGRKQEWDELRQLAKDVLNYDWEYTNKFFRRTKQQLGFPSFPTKE